MLRTGACRDIGKKGWSFGARLFVWMFHLLWWGKALGAMRKLRGRSSKKSLYENEKGDRPLRGTMVTENFNGINKEAKSFQEPFTFL